MTTETTTIEPNVNVLFEELIHSKLFETNIPKSISGYKYYITIPCKLVSGEYHLYLQWKLGDKYYDLPDMCINEFNNTMRYYRRNVHDNCSNWGTFEYYMYNYHSISLTVHLKLDFIDIFYDDLFYDVMLKIDNNEYKLGEFKVRYNNLPNNSLIKIIQYSFNLIKGSIVKDFKNETGSLTDCKLSNNLITWFNNYIMQDNEELQCLINNKVTKCNNIWIKTSNTGKSTIVIDLDGQLHYEYVGDFNELPSTNEKTTIVLGGYNIIETKNEDNETTKLILAFDVINYTYYNITDYSTNKTFLKCVDFNNPCGRYLFKNNLILKIIYENNKCCSKLFQLKDNKTISGFITTLTPFNDDLPLVTSKIDSVDLLDDIIKTELCGNESIIDLDKINLDDI